MRPYKSKVSALAVFALAFFANASTASADFVTFNASGPNGLSASVTFEVSGGNLIVTLTNTASMDVWSSNQVLTAVFFSLPGGLTPVSANVASGSEVDNPTDAGNDAFPNVGGEWAYASGLNVSGSNQGIGSAGFDIFGSNDLFSDMDLDPPASPNGINYGITTADDDPDNSNGGLEDMPLISNSVVFTLSGWDSDWSLSDITDVFFQYGTSLSEPQLAVPEPGVLALLTIGLVGLAFGVRKMCWV